MVILEVKFHGELAPLQAGALLSCGNVLGHFGASQFHVIHTGKPQFPDRAFITIRATKDESKKEKFGVFCQEVARTAKTTLNVDLVMLDTEFYQPYVTVGALGNNDQEFAARRNGNGLGNESKK